MIQIIGLMIACYILTRMAELIADERIGLIVTIFAIITLIVAVLGGLSLLALGDSGVSGMTSIR